MANHFESIYRRCPIWTQNVAVSLYGAWWRRRRMGPIFQRKVAEFRSRERFTALQWREYQVQSLRLLLRHCFATVPHYRETWSSLGIDQRELARFELEDLRRLPTVGKEDVRRSPASFLSEAPGKGRLYSTHTSGSTGTPLEIRMTASTHQTFYAAYEARCRNWAGVDWRMSRAMIGGRLVVPEAVANPPFWRYNAAERQLYLSAFHIAPSTVAHYAGALNRYRPDYLVGYASAHFFLARMLEEANLDVHSPKAILTSSEKLDAEMRAVLERVYRCEVFDGYSGVETCCLASECASHRLHVSPDVGVVELLDEAGRESEPGAEGEIVATGLLNFDQPLVRYRTSDVARRSLEECPCGSSMPILDELVGRVEDTVVGPDGRETVRFHGLVLGLPSIREAQLVQESVDQFTVRIVAPDGLGNFERETIAKRLTERVGDVSIEFEVVGAIERTSRGKFRAVISKVSRETRR
ncbi:MAG: phenylacetate--CoA ligase family protein [Isosphaeraceae bacterium]